MAILAAFATFQIVGEHYPRGIELSLAAAALLFIREILVKRTDEGTLPIVVSAGSVSRISGYICETWQPRFQMRGCFRISMTTCGRLCGARPSSFSRVSCVRTGTCLIY